MTSTAPSRTPVPSRTSVFSFPNPVNDTSARLVASGVVAMAIAFLVTGWSWLLGLLAYGFVARVLCGPRFSPLGRIVTDVVTPRLSIEHRFSPGPPKRFAQGIGATFSIAALIALAVGSLGAAKVIIGLLAVAATLEAAFGLCLGCMVFAWLMRRGVIPDDVCAECSDIWSRIPDPA